MFFGMPTLIELNTVEDCAALCKELGLQFVELNMNLPQYQLNRIDVPYFKEIAEKYGIFYTIHLDENLDVSDFNPYIADGYRRTVMETVALAKELEIPVLNMHLSKGVYFTLPEQKVYLFDRYRSLYLNSIAAFKDLCQTVIDSSKIKICVENCDGFRGFQKEALDILLESPVFGLTYDIGHDHGCGGVDAPYILARQDKLCHMHMHDAIGKKNHMALGTGEMDIAKFLTLAAEQNCRVVLETKTVRGLRESVQWLHGKGYLL